MTTRKQFWISFLIGIAVLVSGIFFVCIHQARAIIVLYRPGTPCITISSSFSANTNTVWNTLDVTSPAPASIIFTTAQMVADSQGNQMFSLAISTAGDGNYNLVNSFEYLYEVPGTYIPTAIFDSLQSPPYCYNSITSTLPYKIVVIGTNTGSFIVKPVGWLGIPVCSNSSVSEVFTLTNLTAIPIVGGTVTFNNGTDYSILAGATFTMLGNTTTNITIQLAPTRTGSYSTEVIFAATGVDSKTGLFTAVSLSNSLAAFSSNTSNGPAPLAVLFTNRTLAGTWTNSNWDFGDGTTATGITPANPVVAHTYNLCDTSVVAQLTVFGLCSSGSASYSIGTTCAPITTNCVDCLTATNQPTVCIKAFVASDSSFDTNAPWNSCSTTNAGFNGSQLTGSNYWLWSQGAGWTNGGTPKVSVLYQPNTGKYEVELRWPVDFDAYTTNGVTLVCSNGVLHGVVYIGVTADDPIFIVTFGGCTPDVLATPTPLCATNFPGDYFNGNYSYAGEYTCWSHIDCAPSGKCTPVFTNSAGALLEIVPGTAGGYGWGLYTNKDVTAGIYDVYDANSIVDGCPPFADLPLRTNWSEYSNGSVTVPGYFKKGTCP